MSAEKPSAVEELLAGARAGSDEALGQVLDACRAYLLMVAEREMDTGLRAKEGASDLVQETFIEAQRAFGRFQGDSEAEFLAWLRRLLLHNVADFRRKYRGTGKRDAGREIDALGGGSSRSWGSAFAADQLTPSGVFIQDEDMAVLDQVIQRLPDEYRQVIQARYVEDMPFEEIALRMGRSANATRKTFARAVQRIRRELEELG